MWQAPRAGLLDLEPHRVLIAVDAHLGHALHVAGLLALLPQLLRERLKYQASPLSIVLRERLGIHVRDHQQLAARGVGHDAVTSPSASNFGAKAAAFLDLFACSR